MVHIAELSDLKTKVENWRKTKTSIRGPMPADLREMVNAAAKTYGIRKVCALLKLDVKNIEQRVARQANTDKSKNKLPNLVRIAPIMMQEQPTFAKPFAVFEGGTGLKLSFFAPLDCQSLSELALLIGGKK